MVNLSIHYYTGQFKATTPDLTLAGGLYKEQYQNGYKLGLETVLNYPDYTVIFDFRGFSVRGMKTNREPSYGRLSRLLFLFN